ncbi:hypothetical protein Mame01_26850 [Microbispora amethystogenes]|nr:hypothetical protein Mame01_26850 [Microbispora amethystogenes]
MRHRLVPVRVQDPDHAGADEPGSADDSDLHMPAFLVTVTGPLGTGARVATRLTPGRDGGAPEATVTFVGPVLIVPAQRSRS